MLVVRLRGVGAALAVAGLLALVACSDESPAATGTAPEDDPPSMAIAVSDGGEANDTPMFWGPFTQRLLLDTPETFPDLKAQSTLTAVGKFTGLREVGPTADGMVLIGAARFEVETVIAGGIDEEVVDLSMVFSGPNARGFLKRAANQVPPGDALVFLKENPALPAVAEEDPAGDPQLFPYVVNGPFGLWARTGDQLVATPIVSGELPGDRFHPFSDTVSSDSTLGDVVALVVGE